MGAWGYDIDDNDKYMDTYGMIMDEFYRGVPIQEIIEFYLNEEGFVGSISDMHNLYFACSNAGWECGYLSEELYNEVKEAIELECDPKTGYWNEISKKEFKYRKECLQKFLAKISVPNPNPKKLRSRPFKRYSYYFKGLYF